jgi:5-bromo-4-chloroindolyl phosphate hydrolysis protein
MIKKFLAAQILVLVGMIFFFIPRTRILGLIMLALIATPLLLYIAVRSLVAMLKQRNIEVDVTEAEVATLRKRLDELREAQTFDGRK